MRPSNSAYDRDTGNFGNSVAHDKEFGWYVLMTDNNDVTVVAEPDMYYATEAEAKEALVVLEEAKKEFGRFDDE